MNMPLRLVMVLLGLLLFSSCTKEPDLAGFDAEAFKQDKGGCMGKRAKQIEWLKTHKENLKAVSSNRLEELIGRPDIQQLADRNQEYYIYFLETGPHCEKLTKPSNSPSIAFRFSAIGLATEVTFQLGVPL
jgi:hypothetical protein